MFVRQSALDSLTASSGDILLLLAALNRPMVALEDYATNEADATICTVRRESDMISTVVHLLLQHGRIGLFYTFESDPYPEDLRGPVEEEALDFVESLGFVMDDVRFADLGPDEQKALLERPMFTGVLAESSGPEPVAAAFEVPPDPAFEFGPMTQDRLDEMTAAPETAEPVAFEAPPVSIAQGPSAAPADTSLQGALPEALPQEMEVVLEEVFQESPEASPEPPRLSVPVSSESSRSAAPRVEPVTPDPLPQEPPVAPTGPLPSGSLSHFRHRSAGADLYTIHGVTASPSAPRATEPPRPAEAPATAPVEQIMIGRAPLPEKSRPSLDSGSSGAGTPGGGSPAATGTKAMRAPEEAAADPELRRRRARARFLASF